MKKIGYTLSVLMMVSLILIIADSYTKASSGEAGTASDPLVTKSYVDNAVNNIKNNSGNTNNNSINTKEIYDYIDKKISENASAQGTAFTVIKVETGQKIIGQESTEIIVRSGNAVAIANAAGDGLSNVTEGVDIKEDVRVPNNHLIIIPRSDGRGIKMNFEGFIMVRGKYTIQ